MIENSGRQFIKVLVVNDPKVMVVDGKLSGVIPTYSEVSISANQIVHFSGNAKVFDVDIEDHVSLSIAGSMFMIKGSADDIQKAIDRALHETFKSVHDAINN